MKRGVYEPEQAQSTPLHQAPSLRTDGTAAPAAENTAMTAMQECFETLEIRTRILRFAQNPTASRVSRNFYNSQEEALRLDYNQNKESHRPNFYYDKEKDRNEATTEQQVEIKYLLRNEADILEKTDNNETIKACFAKLKETQYLNIKPVETIKFIAREKFLDELNAAIINAKILQSKRDDATILDCSVSHLTRFPGKIITQHQDYFKALQKLDLSFNKLQSLPHGIGQLAALLELNLGNNKLQNLPREIGQLAALKKLYLNCNQLQSLPPEIGQMAALQLLYFNDNQLQSLPREIGQMAALQLLYFNDNQLQSLPHEIGQMAALQGLHLDCNQLQSLPPEIGQLTSLIWLSLHNNQLQTLPPEIEQLAALQRLHLNHNQFQTLPHKIRQLAALRVLTLDHNQLQSLPDDLRDDILWNSNWGPATKAQVLALQRKPNPSEGKEVKRSPGP